MVRTNHPLQRVRYVEAAVLPRFVLEQDILTNPVVAADMIDLTADEAVAPLRVVVDLTVDDVAQWNVPSEEDGLSDEVVRLLEAFVEETEEQERRLRNVPRYSAEQVARAAESRARARVRLQATQRRLRGEHVGTYRVAGFYPI